MDNQEKQVLIVDDFGDTAKILAEMFDHLNVSTESADGPDRALAKLKESKYRLVIADSRMPTVNGVSLLKEIRRTSPETKVVLMSTFDSANTRKMVTADGIDYYLPKPVKLKHLEKMITDLALQI